MANQAIALQARAPQTDFMGRAVQQNAQMMNMMSQQRAAERQAAQAAQAMQMEQAKEARAVAGEERAVAKFALDQDALLYAKYRNMAPAVIESNSPEVYRAWLDALVKESPERGAMLAQAMPVERFDAAALARMMATMDDRFAAQYGKAITRELIDPDTGGVSAANISSIPGASFSQPVPDISRPRAGAAAAQTPTSAFPTTAAPATDAQIDEAARKMLRGAGVGELGIGAEDFDRASARANELSAGGGARMQPISMTTGGQMGGQPDLAAVVQDMMQTKQVSQSNRQMMLDVLPPEKAAQFDQILKAQNIQVVPDAQPSMRSAVLRPGEDAAPQMQQVQFNPNAFEQARAKPTGQSPTPGVYNVPPPVIRDVKAAETQGSEGVKVVTQPKITAAEERVKRVEKLRGEVPRALSETQALVDNIDERIRAIDEFLRNPNRGSVIGLIEGRIPRFLQGEKRADVQALFDTIVSNSVLNKLIEDRQQTETGASPQGIVSDRDLAVAAQAANRLTQTGSERQQEIEMQRLRDILYRTRQRAVEKYGVVYREVLPETPELRLRVPSIAPKYEPKPKTETPTQRRPLGQILGGR